MIKLVLIVLADMAGKRPLLLSVDKLLLVVTKALLIDKTAPLLGIFVKRDPSPICCP